MTHEELIIKYIENNCTKTEIEKVAHFMQTDQEFRQELELHQLIHQSLSDEALIEPSNQFTEQVMGKISYKPLVLHWYLYAFILVIPVLAILYTLQHTEYKIESINLSFSTMVYATITIIILLGIEIFYTLYNHKVS